MHGQLNALKSALKNAHHRPGRDQLISLGDVMDATGRHSREVVEALRSVGATLITGNHEDQLVTALRGNAGALAQWIRAMGAQHTMRSYRFDPARLGLAGDGVIFDGRPVRTIREIRRVLEEVFGAVHLAFLTGSPRYKEVIKDFWPGVHLFLCHGGPVEDKEMDELLDWQLVWGDERTSERNLWEPANRNQVVVHGHFHHRRPEFRRQRINLAVYGGVAALSVEEHKVYTSDGEVIEVERQWLRI